MAEEPNKDEHASDASEESPKKASAPPERGPATKSWEEQRASQPPVVPTTSDEPFRKSPSTRPPPLDLDLTAPPAAAMESAGLMKTQESAKPEPKLPSSSKMPVVSISRDVPASMDPESVVETVRTISSEDASNVPNASRIATSSVGEPASPRLAALAASAPPKPEEPQTEPADVPAVNAPHTEPLPTRKPTGDQDSSLVDPPAPRTEPLPAAAAAAAFASVETPRSAPPRSSITQSLAPNEKAPSAPNEKAASQPAQVALPPNEPEKVPAMEQPAPVASAQKTSPLMDPVVPAPKPPVSASKTMPLMDPVTPAAPSPPAPAFPKEENVARAVDAPPRIASSPPKAMPKEGATGGPLAAFEVLARSARLADLVSLTDQIVREAAKARATYWTFTAKVTRAAEEARLGRADVDTPFGNALDVLGRGAENAAESALASALWAHAICEATSGGRKAHDAEEHLAADILWLATHTSFDATPLLDRALGEDAAELWSAIAARVRKIAKGSGETLGRGEAIVGCAALAASGSARAKSLCLSLGTGDDRVEDPVLVRLLSTADTATPDEVRLEGEMVPTPRGPVLTTFLALSGILFFVHAARFIARIALAYKRPTEVSLSDAGVRVKTRTEMLGRTLREREHVIVRAGLVRVVREVRYPRLAFYAGLLALALGSYIGVRAFADGVRAASPSLLVVGILIVAIGIGADFLLGTVLPGTRGRVRLAFVPRSGTVLCVGDIDARRADDALAKTLKAR